LQRAGHAGGVLLLLALLNLASAAAKAAPTAHDGTSLNVVVVPPAAAPHTAPDRWTIYLDGYLDSDSASRVTAAISRYQIPAAQVYLNSPGGSLLAAMAIGRLLRSHGFDTAVGTRTVDPLRPAGGVCYSACPFALAGGVHRVLVTGSLVGVHRAENRLPWLDQSAFERRVQNDATTYLREMGVSPDLYGLMAQVPPGTIRLLRQDEAVHLGLVNSRATASGVPFPNHCPTIPRTAPPSSGLQVASPPAIRLRQPSPSPDKQTPARSRGPLVVWVRA
jgi:hypothetical protein